MIRSLDDFLVPLMLVLDNLPGHAGILDKVLTIFEQKYRVQIDPELYTRNQSGNIRWNWRARWARQELKLIGFIDSPTKGVWRLTDDGHKWLLDHPNLTHLNLHRIAKKGYQEGYLTDNSNIEFSKAAILKSQSVNNEIFPELSPHVILDNEVNGIQLFLNGQSPISPQGEKLCDWIFFCYTFGMYRQGKDLFALIDSEEVNPWYYERTRKIARLCELRANQGQSFERG